MDFPSIQIFTGSENYTTRLIRDIYYLVKFKSINFSKIDYCWEVVPHWENGGTKEDIIFTFDGYDKIGYLRLHDSINYLIVYFISQSPTGRNPYLASAFLLARFAAFIKHHIKDIPFNISISF